MDKRYKALSAPEQLMLRKQALDDVLAHPEWPLPQVLRHLRTTMRLTTAEMAKIAGVSHRTLQEVELGRSEGTVHTLNRVLGVLGLRLGVVSKAPAAGTSALESR